VYYENNKTKIEIICSTHGSFWQRPNHHLYQKQKQGCPTCGGSESKTRELFIRDAQQIHGDKYNYSKVEYINAYTKVKIICPKHGSFMQSPTHHIHKKTGCPRCVNAGYSKISIKFLSDLAREWKVDIQHAENKGEFKIEDPDFKCYYKVDGYFERDNKKYVVEFHGDYFHANPLIYKPDGICKLRRMRFDEIYNKTMERMY